MPTIVNIIEVNQFDDSMLEQLAKLTIAIVNDGASIGFLPPLNVQDCLAYWKQVLDEHVVLWVALIDEKICGTVQLQLATKANSLHRAEVAKLMVHPCYRRKGIAKLLLKSLEGKAIALQKSLLILDTREGDPSNSLYKNEGYIEVGSIPQYAKSANGQLDATIIYYKII